MRQALAGYQQTGAGIMRPYYLALLADVSEGRKGKRKRLTVGRGGSGSSGQ